VFWISGLSGRAVVTENGLMMAGGGVGVDGRVVMAGGRVDDDGEGCVLAGEGVGGHWNSEGT
jgi:hypothetical protein